jgi:hypothetical protein
MTVNAADAHGQRWALQPANEPIRFISLLFERWAS